MSTKAQRRRYIFQCLADSLQLDVDTGGEWFEEGPDGEKGADLLREEAADVVREFHRRGRKDWKRSRDG